MADTRPLSALPDVPVPLQDGDLVYIARAGVPYKIAYSALYGDLGLQDWTFTGNVDLTGATNLAAIPGDLGLAIGTDVQAYSQRLDDLSVPYAEGDLITADAAGVLAPVAIGPAGTVPVSDGTKWAWAAQASTDWEFVEDSYSGATVTTFETSTLQDNYVYMLEFIDLEHNAGGQRVLLIDFYGETAGGYTGAPMNFLSYNTGWISQGIYGSLEFSNLRTVMNTRAIGPCVVHDTTTPATSDIQGSPGPGVTGAAVVHYATAQKIDRLRFSLNGAGSFDNGTVKLWRKGA